MRKEHSCVLGNFMNKRRKTLLQVVDICDFNQMYNLMEKSFPVDEHRPYEEQKELFQKEIYKVYGFYLESDIKEKLLQGFLATWNLGEFLFIEHFAVDSSLRNRGIGSKMLHELSKTKKVRLCLEVEPPESELTKRRIAFYERNGFFYHDFSYVQPALSKGQNAISLKLMTTGGNLNQTEFERVRDLLYNRVYEI